MDDFSALTILSAIITPAVLILACGSLILATSQRLGRMVGRTREISDQFEELDRAQTHEAAIEEKRTLLSNLLIRSTERSRLLQRAMTCLYLALSVFVATSVVIGVVDILGRKHPWMPILLGMLAIVGLGFLFYASLILIKESRIAIGAVNDEMDYVLGLSRRNAAAELLKQRRNR